MPLFSFRCAALLKIRFLRHDAVTCRHFADAFIAAIAIADDDAGFADAFDTFFAIATYAFIFIAISLRHDWFSVCFADADAIFYLFHFFAHVSPCLRWLLLSVAFLRRAFDAMRCFHTSHDAMPLRAMLPWAPRRQTRHTLAPVAFGAPCCYFALCRIISLHWYAAIVYSSFRLMSPHAFMLCRAATDAFIISLSAFSFAPTCCFFDVCRHFALLPLFFAVDTQRWFSFIADAFFMFSLFAMLSLILLLLLMLSSFMISIFSLAALPLCYTGIVATFCHVYYLRDGCCVAFDAMLFTCCYAIIFALAAFMPPCCARRERAIIAGCWFLLIDYDFFISIFHCHADFFDAFISLHTPLILPFSITSYAFDYFHWCCHDICCFHYYYCCLILFHFFSPFHIFIYDWCCFHFAAIADWYFWLIFTYWYAIAASGSAQRRSGGAFRLQTLRHWFQMMSHHFIYFCCRHFHWLLPFSFHIIDYVYWLIVAASPFSIFHASSSFLRQFDFHLFIFLSSSLPFDFISLFRLLFTLFSPLSPLMLMHTIFDASHADYFRRLCACYCCLLRWFSAAMMLCWCCFQLFSMLIISLLMPPPLRCFSFRLDWWLSLLLSPLISAFRLLFNIFFFLLSPLFRHYFHIYW